MKIEAHKLNSWVNEFKKWSARWATMVGEKTRPTLRTLPFRWTRDTMLFLWRSRVIFRVSELGTVRRKLTQIWPEPWRCEISISWEVSGLFVVRSRIPGNYTNRFYSTLIVCGKKWGMIEALSRHACSLFIHVWNFCFDVPIILCDVIAFIYTLFCVYSQSRDW